MPGTRGHESTAKGIDESLKKLGLGEYIHQLYYPRKVTHTYAQTMSTSSLFMILWLGRVLVWKSTEPSLMHRKPERFAPSASPTSAYLCRGSFRTVELIWLSAE
jgi:hypothetical protein